MARDRSILMSLITSKSRNPQQSIGSKLSNKMQDNIHNASDNMQYVRNITFFRYNI